MARSNEAPGLAAYGASIHADMNSAVSPDSISRGRSVCPSRAPKPGRMAHVRIVAVVEHAGRHVVVRVDDDRVAIDAERAG